MRGVHLRDAPARRGRTAAPPAPGRPGRAGPCPSPPRGPCGVHRRDLPEHHPPGPPGRGTSAAVRRRLLVHRLAEDVQHLAEPPAGHRLLRVAAAVELRPRHSPTSAAPSATGVRAGRPCPRAVFETAVTIRNTSAHGTTCAAGASGGGGAIAPCRVVFQCGGVLAGLGEVVGERLALVCRRRTGRRTAARAASGRRPGRAGTGRRGTRAASRPTRTWRGCGSGCPRRGTRTPRPAGGSAGTPPSQPPSLTKNGMSCNSGSCLPALALDPLRSSAVTGTWYDRQHAAHPRQSQFWTTGRERTGIDIGYAL